MHTTDVIIAISAGITTLATIIMAVFAGIMLNQLKHMKEQNELLRQQGEQADDWQRKNNVLTYYSLNKYRDLYKIYAEAIKQYFDKEPWQLPSPITEKEIQRIKSAEILAIAIYDLLEYFEEMCSCVLTKTVDEYLIYKFYCEEIRTHYYRYVPLIKDATENKDIVGGYCDSMEYCVENWEANPMIS